MTLTTLDPRPALVVIDLQKGIAALPGVPALDDVIQRSAGLAAAFRRHGLPVVLVNASGRAARAHRGQPARVHPAPRLGRHRRGAGPAAGRPAGDQADLGRVPRHPAGHAAARPRRHPDRADRRRDQRRGRVHRAVRARARLPRGAGHRRDDRPGSRRRTSTASSGSSPGSARRPPPTTSWPCSTRPGSRVRPHPRCATPQ